MSDQLLMTLEKRESTVPTSKQANALAQQANALAQQANALALSNSLELSGNKTRNL
ncbi:hypothetical protein LC653_01885 [Nostoc sp. CHAB 5784]|uniref:hypothetical protein n=1 Tax=Nostoc mirabile TaxID=2907820 RepID=UPI001E2D94D5|nr:hypothetical protein [Nostoc mirabile]MCC5662711.1 hypothetical protein [Nostoc mirabile CHAB5784]